MSLSEPAERIIDVPAGTKIDPREMNRATKVIVGGVVIKNRSGALGASQDVSGSGTAETLMEIAYEIFGGKLSRIAALGRVKNLFRLGIFPARPKHKGKQHTYCFTEGREVAFVLALCAAGHSPLAAIEKFRALGQLPVGRVKIESGEVQTTVNTLALSYLVARHWPKVVTTAADAP